MSDIMIFNWWENKVASCHSLVNEANRCTAEQCLPGTEGVQDQERAVAMATECY